MADLLGLGLKTGKAALKLLGKNKTLASVFGVGNARAAAGSLARRGQMASRFVGKSALSAGAGWGLGQIVDAGPDADESEERAMNQLRYGVDMTDADMEKALKEGKSYKDSGIIGEGGISEEEARAYLRANADQRSELEQGASAALTGISTFGRNVPVIGGLLQAAALPVEMLYDSKLGESRQANLKNMVDKLKLDANEVKIRKNYEGSLGKAMAEGLLGKEFGNGKVRANQGNGRGKIETPEEAKARESQAAALKEYNKIKAEKGIQAAIASPHAKNIGQQLYADINELVPQDVDPRGRRAAMEAYLVNAGVMDYETFNKNQTGKSTKELTAEMDAERAKTDAARAAAAAEAAAKQTAAEAAKTATLNPGGSAGLNLTPAKNADEVRANQAAISAERGYYGQSPIANEQQSYLNANGMKTSTQLNSSLSDPGWQALIERHGKRLEASKEQFRQNRAAEAERQYKDFIVKPTDPNYGLRKPGDRMDTKEESDAWYQAALARARGEKVPLPGQVNQAANAPVTAPAPTPTPTPNPTPTPAPAPAPAPAPLPNQVNAAAVAPTPKPTVPFTMSPTPYGVGTANRGTGIPQFNLPDIGGAMKAAGEAFGNKLFPQSLPGQGPMVMRPTPNGLGGPTPGIPQLPDIGAPGRAMGEAVGNKLFPQSIPAKPAGPMVMRPTPNGLGTATPGIPQVPDIGAAARQAGESMANKVLPQSLPGNPPAKPAMTPEEIAKMLAEQKAAEANRVKGMKMPAPGGPSPRFRHPAQGPNNRPN